MTAESTNGIRKSNRRWQSDVIVDLVKRYGFPYVALNPGASYRGLHDSLVNYGENDPPILLCNHEKIAVQIAHGYARDEAPQVRNGGARGTAVPIRWGTRTPDAGRRPGPLRKRRLRLAGSPSDRGFSRSSRFFHKTIGRTAHWCAAVALG
jgi:hypothetical protein